MLKLLTFLLCTTLASSACGPQQTISNEAKKLCCYYDSQNIPTIGIGFNLQRADASIVMSTYKLTLSNVLQDCQKKTNKSCLTSSQADDIFNRISYPEAAACADRYVANLPTNKRAAIIDVAFAGCATLNKFVKMKAALDKKDWKQAGNELRTSAWCTQVGQNRCNSDYNCIVEG
jgi:GH24 family phage-related lysozyme (muramidase)